MAKLTLLLAAALAAQGVQGSAPPAESVDPTPIEPASAWRIDYGNERCLALRTYGAADSAVTLTLEQGALAEILTIGVASRGLAEHSAPDMVRLAIGEAVIAETQFIRSHDLPQRQRMLRVDIDADAEPRLRGAQTLSFTPQRGERVVFRLSAMNQILDHLARCHDGLLESWGVDLAARRAQRSPPVPINPERWIARMMLPYFSGRAEGAVLLTVSAEGRVTACRTLDTSGLLEVDQNICRQLTSRARFTPAIGPEGTPVPAQVIRRMRYMSSY